MRHFQCILLFFLIFHSEYELRVIQFKQKQCAASICFIGKYTVLRTVAVYYIFWSNPWMYEPRSSSWLFHESRIFLCAPFGSDSTINWTEAMEISHVSDIVTVHPVNFSCSNAYNFSLVRVNGPGSSILIFDVNLQGRKKVPN